jgi:FtsH-binding integral membrane protein
MPEGVTINKIKNHIIDGLGLLSIILAMVTYLIYFVIAFDHNSTYVFLIPIVNGSAIVIGVIAYYKYDDRLGVFGSMIGIANIILWILIPFVDFGRKDWGIGVTPV